MPMHRRRPAPGRGGVGAAPAETDRGPHASPTNGTPAAGDPADCQRFRLRPCRAARRSGQRGRGRRRRGPATPSQASGPCGRGRCFPAAAQRGARRAARRATGQRGEDGGGVADALPALVGLPQPHRRRHLAGPQRRQGVHIRGAHAGGRPVRSEAPDGLVVDSAVGQRIRSGHLTGRTCANRRTFRLSSRGWTHGDHEDRGAGRGFPRTRGDDGLPRDRSAQSSISRRRCSNRSDLT